MLMMKGQLDSAKSHVIEKNVPRSADHFCLPLQGPNGQESQVTKRLFAVLTFPKR